ncbi:MAG: hypothetical protein ABR554_11495 [Pyrinomonadaceae bacterium]
MKTAARVALACALAALSCVSAGSRRSAAQDAPGVVGGADGLKELLARVGERVAKYQERLFSVTFTETVRQQELRADGQPKGKPREFVYETTVVRRGGAKDAETGAPVMTRRLKSVDGKPAKPEKQPTSPSRDDEARSKCGDIEPPRSYGDPLSFLLPPYSNRFVFAYEGESELEGRKVKVVSFAETPADAPPELTDDGRCFRLSRGLRYRGRVLIDPKTYDVLEVRWELAEKFAGRTSTRVVRRGALFKPAFSRELAWEKSEMTIRFQPVTFRDPEQTLLLPVSYEWVRVLKGARQRFFRTRQTNANYKRFRTSAEIKEIDDKNDDKPPPR